MSGEAMTAERVRAIRERAEACAVWLREPVSNADEHEFVRNKIVAGAGRLAPDVPALCDAWEAERARVTLAVGEVTAGLARVAREEALTLALATVTAERDQARDALRGALGYPHRKQGQP